MQISENSVVRFHYKLTDDDGQLLDSSEGSEPLAYVHGTESMIPGLEKELQGKTDGDSFKARIAPEDAYGEHDEDAIQTIARGELPDDAEIEPGVQFEAEDEEGDTMILTVTAVEGDDVTLDANHPLAGVALNFEVTVVDVREASSEEIEHGHPHGPGGHEH